MHTCDAWADSLGFTDEHHAGAVQPDELSSSKQKVHFWKREVFLY